VVVVVAPAGHDGDHLRLEVEDQPVLLGYPALKGLSQLMHAPDAPGLELPGIDITGIATFYGIDSAQVESLSDLNSAVKQALHSDQPHLIGVPERRIAGG
jgi:thiamine pyrophosphate-dependent acetolactate synthase large subunit-like protein